MTLLKLNVLAYPDGIVPKALSMKGYYEATLADVIAAGDGLFNTSSWAADKAAMQGKPPVLQPRLPPHTHTHSHSHRALRESIVRVVGVVCARQVGYMPNLARFRAPPAPPPQGWARVAR